LLPITSYGRKCDGLLCVCHKTSKVSDSSEGSMDRYLANNEIFPEISETITKQSFCASTEEI
ncbi:hypothetical protein CEXT_771371, partial [Caerostris extrusa]